MKPILLGVLVIDRPKTTAGCLEQLLKWNRDKYDLVVVDNNSNAETKEMIQQYRDDIDILIEMPCNTGCVFPMNYYMSMLQPGQHFMKIDVDAHIQTPDWADQMLTLVQEPDLGIIMGRRPSFWSELHERQIYFGQAVRLIQRGIYYLESVSDTGVVWPWGMIKSEVIEKIGYLNEAICTDDIEYGPRAISAGFKAVYVPSIILDQSYHQEGHPNFEEQHHPQYHAYHACLGKHKKEFQARLWEARAGRNLYCGTRFKKDTITDQEYLKKSDENWEFFKNYGKQSR